MCLQSTSESLPQQEKGLCFSWRLIEGGSKLQIKEASFQLQVWKLRKDSRMGKKVKRRWDMEWENSNGQEFENEDLA